MKYLIIIALMFAVSAPAKASVYEKDYFGETEIHKAAFEDTLIHLARKNALGFVELRAANPTLDPWIPGAGARIILPKKHILPEAPRKGLVINLAEMRVYYFKDAGKEPLTYPISIGREGLQTPTGSTKVVRKKAGPQWRPTPRMRKEDPDLPAVVEAGPDNPLGDYALYFGWPTYAMHGTNKPYGIGRRVSSGCIRMYPESIKALFPMVPVGTSVTVVDQPVKVGWVEDQLYVEVSPNQDQSIKIEEDGVVKSYEITAEDMKRITKKAGTYADKINWTAVRKAVQEHRGYPVVILDKNRKPSRHAQSDLDKMMVKAEVTDKDAKIIQQSTETKTAATETVKKKQGFKLKSRASYEMNE
jgi:L,D-transpeptidase ErfK/SrfK